MEKTLKKSPSKAGLLLGAAVTALVYFIALVVFGAVCRGVYAVWSLGYNLLGLL